MTVTSIPGSSALADFYVASAKPLAYWFPAGRPGHDNAEERISLQAHPALAATHLTPRRAPKQAEQMETGASCIRAQRMHPHHTQKEEGGGEPPRTQGEGNVG